MKNLLLNFLKVSFYYTRCEYNGIIIQAHIMPKNCARKRTLIVHCCNDIVTHSWSTDLPQFTIGMHKSCFANNVVFIIKVNPVNLKQDVR